MKTLSCVKYFTDTLQSAGIVYRILLSDGEVLVVVDAVAGPNNGGVEGMSTTFHFDARTGALIYMSTWGGMGAAAS